MADYIKFIQRIGLVGITNILISLSSLIFIPVITKSFTTAEYGMWAQVNTTIALVPNIANLGLPFTMVRFLSAEHDKGIILSNDERDLDFNTHHLRTIHPVWRTDSRCAF